MNAIELADDLEQNGIGMVSKKLIIAELRRLHAENESLRKDAGRYRFIRDDKRDDDLDVCDLDLNSYHNESLDAAIDAAMGEGK